MSDNGPHMQPPQYPYGGESGGQPAGPYGGGPHGPPGPGHDPPGGGQYPPGPYGTGPQYPPPEQGMYQGGAPPHGPPGPGMPPGPGGYPPPKKSNLGLWIVLGGGLVIVVLIGLVVVMLVRGGSSDGEQVAGSDTEESGEEAAADEEDTDEQDDGDEDEDAADAPETEVGEPPHALPDDACAGLSDDSLADLDASESRTQSDDNRTSCTFDTRGDVDIDGEMTITYRLPFVDTDSASEAASDFDYHLDTAMDESSDIIDYTVLEDEELDLGDQAHIVFREVDNVWMSNEAIVLIQQDNMIVELDWTLDPDDILDDDAPAPADYADVEDYLPDLGAEALDNMG